MRGNAINGVGSKTNFSGLALLKLGPPVVPLYSLFWGEGSPTTIDDRKKLVPLP